MRAVILTLLMVFSVSAHADTALIPFQSQEINQNIFKLKTYLAAQPNPAARLTAVNAFGDFLAKYLRRNSTPVQGQDFINLNTFQSNIDAIDMKSLTGKNCSIVHSHLIQMNLPHADDDGAVSATMDAPTKNTILILGWLCGDLLSH